MKIECKICKARIIDGTIPEHYEIHHPEAYQEYLKSNAEAQLERQPYANRQMRKFNRKEF